MTSVFLLTRNASRSVTMEIRQRLKWLCLFASASLILACEEEQREPPVTISVKLFPARLVEDPTAEPEAGWRTMKYGGGVRAGAGTYLVAPEPIMTEWNISAFKTASQPDGSAAVTSYTGATLGGLWRMRGFPAQRFSDKAAIYYSAELRLIPEWNPFDDWPDLQKHVGVEWLQFVPFVEVGRVGPEYDLENLHSSLKWDVGLGLRAWAKGIVVRLDTAWSDEGFGLQMMVGQPFQF